MELLALAHFDLPTERKAKTPGGCRSPCKHLSRLEERHPLPAAADDLESHHHVSDRKGVAEEETGEVPIRGLSAESAGLQFALGGERLGAAPPQGIGQGLGTADVPVELFGRPVQVAMMEEELQAPERRLPAPICKRYEMRGAQKPVARYGAEDIEIARRERYAAYRSALEARPANVRGSHRLTLPVAP